MTSDESGNIISRILRGSKSTDDPESSPPAPGSIFDFTLFDEIENEEDLSPAEYERHVISLADFVGPLGWDLDKLPE